MPGIASGKSTSTGLNYLPAAPARTGVMLLGLLLLSQVSAAGKITYTLSFEERNAHYVTVNLELDGVRYRDSLDLKMPVWAPGSYKVRDFSRHVEGVRVTSGSREIPISKLDKNSWRVRLSGQRRINIKYKVYAFEKSVRTSFVNSDMALLNGSSIFMYVKGMEHQESLVVINIPRGWLRATSSLPLVGGRSPVFRAPDYDTLVDSPFMVGSHTVLETQVDGVPFRYAIAGQAEFDREQLLADTRKIAGEMHKIFGTVPYDQFTIFLVLAEKRGGGLEHLNSTYLLVSRWIFEEPKSYRSYLALLAHELYHAYNVKRIRPRALGPFDYDRENYTTQLWVAEGLTDYYERQLLLRAGLIDADEYLEMVAETMEKLLKTPGRHKQSLEDASFDAWIKYKMPNENSGNTTVSYYKKGDLVGVVLDLAIRDATAGEASLDDVFRALWRAFEETGEGYTPEQFRQVCEQAAGRPLDDVFRYVSTTDEIDWSATFAPFGLEVVTAHSDPGDTAKAYWGFETQRRDGNLVITKIHHGSPASDSRLSVDDELLFLDTYRLTPTDAQKIMDSRVRTEKADFVVSRDGLMRTLRVKPGRPPLNSISLVKLAEPTERQKQLYANWLGAAWE